MSFSRVGPNQTIERGQIRVAKSDHVIFLSEAGLRRMLRSYFDYYERSMNHLSLGKDAPISRPWRWLSTTQRELLAGTGLDSRFSCTGWTENDS